MIGFNLKSIVNLTKPKSCLDYTRNIVEIQVDFDGLSYTDKEQ